jgi:hypothetical protein
LPRPPINLHQKVRAVVQHVSHVSLPQDASHFLARRRVTLFCRFPFQTKRRQLLALGQNFPGSAGVILDEFVEGLA